jgi:hypothetical protein
LCREFIVGVHGRSDDHRLNFGIFEHTLESACDPRGWIAPLELRQALAIEVTDPANIDILVIGEDTQKVGSPITESHDRDPNGAQGVTGWLDRATLGLCDPSRPQHGTRSLRPCSMATIA